MASPDLTPASSDFTAPAGSGADPSRRRALGAFYTPDHVVDYMVGLLSGLDASSSVLEPSGGDGAFVEGLLRSGRLSPGQVEVWDADPACRAPVEALGARFSLRDSLLAPDSSKRFSHILGNPPYLNKQSAYLKAHRSQLRRRFSDIGVNDTYAMFTRLAVSLLQPAGELVFLLSDTFLTLGIHARLRALLLSDTSINSVTLLPAATFADAAVSTAVLHLTNTPPSAGHEVRFLDLRHRAPGEYDNLSPIRVSQATLASLPAQVFAFDSFDVALLSRLPQLPKLVDHLDGGLGMYTRDNRRFLALVEYPGCAPRGAASQAAQRVPAGQVDGVAWRFYHKKGGSQRWFSPAEHAVRWDEDSRVHYGIPASALAGEPSPTSTPSSPAAPRAGFIVSGVAARLTAREMTPAALWESNKAFGFFPKDPQRFPPHFWVALFNSSFFARAVRALNHTVSLQIRDIQALPMLPFTPAEVASLANLGSRAIAAVRAGRSPAAFEAKVDALVARVALRADLPLP